MNGLMRKSHGNFKCFFTNIGYVPYASPVLRDCDLLAED